MLLSSSQAWLKAPTYRPKTVALFLPNWVGDVVMATPAIRAIRRHFRPPTALIGIMRPKMVELLAGSTWFDETWLWEPRIFSGENSQLALVQRMRWREVDLLVLFTNSLRTAVLGFLGRARQRVGYARDGRSLFLTGKVFPPRKGRAIAPEPMVLTYLRLAEAVGCPPEPPHLELHLTQEEIERAHILFSRLGFVTELPTAALVYAGAQGPARRWPVDYYVELARQIVLATRWQVLVVVGPNDVQVGLEICRRVNHPRVQTMAGEEDLGLSVAKACLGACELCISPDSGPRHIAAALGKPVITLYGPTDPIWGANPTVHSVDLYVDLPCRGCLQPVCPLRHHRCMRELTPAMVLSAFLKLASEIEQGTTIAIAQRR